MKFDVAFPLLMDQCILICMKIWFLPGKSYNNVSTFNIYCTLWLKSLPLSGGKQKKKKSLSKALLSLTNVQYEQPFHHFRHDIKPAIILDEVFCSASILFFWKYLLVYVNVWAPIRICVSSPLLMTVFWSDQEKRCSVELYMKSESTVTLRQWSVTMITDHNQMSSSGMKI